MSPRLPYVLAALCSGACGRSPVLLPGHASHGSFGSGYEDGGGDGNDGEQRCRDVDFLFVIDNSGSMKDNQSKVVTNYDVFVEGILDTVDAVETMHVGVVTTDAYPWNPESCRSLGGLVVQTGGQNSSDYRCGPYAGGHNYMTEDDVLEDSFRCAAKVGTDGSGAESPLAAAMAAITEPLALPGQCNEGFIRAGALLVLVIVTDEDAEMDPLFAAETIFATKGSDIVVVLLANTPDSECVIEGGAEVAEGLAGFASLFPHGFLGSICDASYEKTFAQAVLVVQDACGV